MSTVPCPECGMALVVYRSQETTFRQSFQFRYHCLYCKKAFLLPEWIIYFFLLLITIFYFSFDAWGKTIFLMLFEPLIHLAKAETISFNTLVWSGTGIVIILSSLFSYLAVTLSIKFISSRLIEIPLSGLNGWKVFHRNIRKEIWDDLQDIKHFPLWQKIVASVFTAVVIGLVTWLVAVY